MRCGACATLFLVGAAGCSDLVTKSFGKDDGIPAVSYQDAYSLPQGMSPSTMPDGQFKVTSAGGRQVNVRIDSRSDGSRDVTWAVEAVLFDGPTSGQYHRQYGDGKLSAINGVTLSLEELYLDGLCSYFAGGTELEVAGKALNLPGDSVQLPDDILASLRAQLLADEPVTIPVSFSIHLPPNQSGILPASLYIYFEVQPTLYVNLLDAI